MSHQSFRSFVRVRPFINREVTTCPEGSPVPRGILVRSKDTVSVLDPVSRFRPKKNGVFPVGNENILWSFVEDSAAEADGPLHDQQQVYESVVAPVIPSIVEGYNAAFVVHGANESGRTFTMFGPSTATQQQSCPLSLDTSGGGDVSSPSAAGGGISGMFQHVQSIECPPLAPTLSPRAAGSTKGIFYRFCTDIFAAYQHVFIENGSSLSVEVEVVEIVNDQYHDLLSSKAAPQSSGQLTSHRSASAMARPAPSPSASFSGGGGRSDDNETIKVILDPIEGSKLSGVTRATVSNADQLEQVVRGALRPLRRRPKSTHVVHLRLTETFEFTDPDAHGSRLSKARRVSVVFVVLHAPPPSFHRCIDVAIERDSGEKPSAMVPYRDSAFTKLYADIFMQGFHTTFVNCVSPFYEHVKDAMHTLSFAIKIRKIRCNPKLNQDENLVELRKLSNEVKGLKSQVVKENESLTVVQSELDRRERDIINKESILAEQQAALCDRQCQRQLLDVVVEVQVLRTQRQAAAMRDHIDCLEKTIQRRNSVLRGLIEERLRVDAEAKEARSKAIELETLRLKHEAICAPLKQRIAQRAKQEEEVSALEFFIAAEPEDKKKEVAQAFEKKRELATQISEAEEEKKQVRAALGDAKIRLDERKPSYDAVQEEESRRHQAEQLKSQWKALQEELRKLETENERLQLEIDKAPSSACCTLM